jgi:hypothetical protein
MLNAFLFVTPVELVCNQLIAQHTSKANNYAHGISGERARTPHYNGPTHVIRHLLSTHAMTVIRDSLGCGCFFYTFFFMKQHYLPN